MTTVSDHAAAGQWDSATTGVSQPQGTETVERYETDDGTVFFDAQNPLAWMEASVTLTLAEQV